MNLQLVANELQTCSLAGAEARRKGGEAILGTTVPTQPQTRVPIRRVTPAPRFSPFPSCNSSGIPAGFRPPARGWTASARTYPGNPSPHVPNPWKLFQPESNPHASVLSVLSVVQSAFPTSARRGSGPRIPACQVIHNCNPQAVGWRSLQRSACTSREPDPASPAK
jgi:hypothetical protein